MLSFATEVSLLVHSFRQMDDVAEKIASAEDSGKAQQSVAQGSHALYDVILKVANDSTERDIPGHLKVAACVNNMSRTLGKGVLAPDVNLKIASAAAVDEALTNLLVEQPDNTKLAEMRAFGREYMMEILRGVI